MTEEEARMIGRAIREEAQLIAVPVENPMERRAVCLKFAIETRGRMVIDDATFAAGVGEVIGAARHYDAYITGEELPK